MTQQLKTKTQSAWHRIPQCFHLLVLHHHCELWWYFCWCILKSYSLLNLILTVFLITKIHFLQSRNKYIIILIIKHMSHQTCLTTRTPQYLMFCITMYTATVHSHNSKGRQRSTAGLSQKLRCDRLLKKVAGNNPLLLQEKPLLILPNASCYQVRKRTGWLPVEKENSYETHHISRGTRSALDYLDSNPVSSTILD